MFLDIRIPGLSRFEVARRIAGRCPVAFVTVEGGPAQAVARVVKRVRRDGVIGFEADSRGTRMLFHSEAEEGEALWRTPLQALLAPAVINRCARDAANAINPFHSAAVQHR